MEYQHWLRETINQLQASKNPWRDTEILLEHITNSGHTFILTFGETQLTDEQHQQLDALLTCHRDGGPITHLAGMRELWSLLLFVSPVALVPRPDTECLVGRALAQLPEQPHRILDLGAGAGTIALAPAGKHPGYKITTVDRMPDIVSLAQRNAQHLAIKDIRVLQNGRFSTLAEQQFAAIVNNPSYIDEQDPHFQQSDVRFKLLTVLVAANDGMTGIVHIIEQSRNALVSGDFLLLKHSWQQDEAARQVFVLTEYHDVETCRDYRSSKRVTLSRYYQ